MTKLIKVTTVDEMPLDTMKSFNIKGKTIMICNVDGSYFALDDNCTHEHCSLSGEGFLDEKKIICGCHGAQFNAESGQVVSPPATTNLKTYKTVIKGNDLFIELES